MRTLRRLGWVCVTLALISAPVFTQSSSSRLEQLKKEAVADVERMKDFSAQMVDQVFSFGELGFQEFETSRYLIDILKKNGFQVQEGISGIPTAWMATWGSGKPVIALGSDIDGIPKASQKPGVGYHDPIIAGAPGHGEGHNSGIPLNITAALAVKKIMEREKIPGTLKVWPGVAEELLGTKAYFVRDGYFKDVDICLFTHVGNNLGVSWGLGSGNGMVSIEYTFFGESAHSAGAPWRGRSALDAVELMNIGWNYRREHLRTQQRSHYVITNGGDQPNVVPSEASVWYYFRETDYPRISQMYEIGNTMAQAAAMMTGTTLKSRILGQAWPQHMNKTVAEVAHKNIEAVGLPAWTEADQTLAKALQEELGSPQNGLDMKIQPLSDPPREASGGGSDDIGDISWNVPTITLR
ncbi:MAG: amidohydrolase, partial [Acidobacteria bacterium]|nr:amidohydrolase [Acidobacteriota bacterium]